MTRHHSPDKHIFMAGLNIELRRASRLASQGVLERVHEGVYVTANHPRISEIVAQHAARIVARSYPEANLCYSSALALGAVGREVYLGGTYKRVRRYEHLDFIQSISPSGSDLTHKWATVSDSLGEVRVLVASDELAFLQMFERVTRYPGKRISDFALNELCERILTANRNSDTELMRVLKYIADHANCRHLYPDATNYIVRFMSARDRVSARARPSIDLKVYWNHRHIADLAHNGIEWEFGYRRDWCLPLSFFELRRSKRLPPFIAALMPEHSGMDAGGGDFSLNMIRSGVKYLSNICITADADRMAATPVDVLEGKLSQHSVGGVFSGKLMRLSPKSFASSFNENMTQLWADRPIPRISGIMLKVPATLDAHGHLHPAVDTAFTHILKLSGVGDWEPLGGVEWFCLEVARRAGLNVAKSALVVPQDGSAPSVVSERFDVRHDKDDRRLMVAEDFCSVFGLPPGSKYEGNMEEVAKKVVQHSTSPEEDLEELYRQVIAAWVMANGDFHLKNISLLKVASPTLDKFESVRLAPAYDMLCTKVFPGFADDDMSLPVCAKKENFSRDDFVNFGRNIGIKAARASEILETLSFEMAKAAVKLYDRRPAVLTEKFPRVESGIEKTTGIMVERAADLLKMKPKMLVAEIRGEPERPKSVARPPSPTRPASPRPR